MTHTTYNKISKLERKARLKCYIQDHYLPDGSFNYGAYRRYEKLHEERRKTASQVNVSHKTPGSSDLRDVIIAYEFGICLLEKVQNYAEQNKKGTSSYKRVTNIRTTEPDTTSTEIS
jgi:hypothetical protein